tara:strand:- start:625 stop:969 length:345 start_codon:yes stop_codon:yes gene_type:complete
MSVARKISKFLGDLELTLRQKQELAKIMYSAVQLNDNGNAEKLILAEPVYQIPWSTALQTADGERICIISKCNPSDDYPILCLIDYGTEVGCDTYTVAGDYDIGVSSQRTLISI